MAKIFGSANKNDKTHDKQPDLKGYVKIGGHEGKNAEAKNRECAMWLKNLVTEFSDKKETYISLAIWKNIDKETDQPYLSIALEDNSWRSKDGGKGSDRPTRNSAGSIEGKIPSGGSEVEIEDIAF